MIYFFIGRKRRKGKRKEKGLKREIIIHTIYVKGNFYRRFTTASVSNKIKV